MRPQNSPKKRKINTSVDGILQTDTPLKTPGYYRGNGSLGNFDTPSTPRHRMRRAPNTEPSKDSDQPRRLLGNFDTSSTLGDKTYDPPRHLPTPKEKKIRKHRIWNWWKNRSLKLKIFILLLSILLVLGGVFGLRIRSFFDSVFSKNVGNSGSSALSKNINVDQLKTEGDGRFNVLLLGRGGVENEAPDLTDTIIIASIDLQNQTTSLLSIPRDTWVNIDGQNMKINAAYSNAKMRSTYKGKSKEDAENDGIRSSIDAVRTVAGVPIHRYLLTDYKAFRDVVNALGGVDITLSEAIYDGFAGWKFPTGQQHMNGDKALQFARTRHGSARGDFDRNEHQRQLLVAMRTKATSTGIIANPVRLNSLANAVQKNIRTDLSMDEARSLYEKTKSMMDASIISLDLAKPDGPLITTGNINGASVVLPKAGQSDYSQIRAYARKNMIDPLIRKESPKIAVYNAGGLAGIATFVGDILSSYGYNVLTKGTGNNTQSQTLIVKMTKDAKPYTDRYLSVRFNAGITHDLPNGVVPATDLPSNSTSNSGATTPQPDYIIILGNSYTQGSGVTW